MRRVRPQCQKRKKRRYHLVDTEPLAFEVIENPDWLVGSN